ncbi:MAG: hypothetical protein ASARMPREDX12_001811 [Alectoria sarmentosa]|nr:MAG: hypothetical protein ASARMPREDX12_001811 [Alectoria sarmentosa]
MLVAKLVGTVDKDDDDELLREDDAITKDTALLDKEPIVEGALISDGALIELEIPGKEEVTIVVSEVEELEISGLAKELAELAGTVGIELAELAGNVGIELPLPTIEVPLEDEAIDWDEELKLERLVLWPVITLVEEDSELEGPIL